MAKYIYTILGLLGLILSLVSIGVSQSPDDQDQPNPCKSSPCGTGLCHNDYENRYVCRYIQGVSVLIGFLVDFKR